MFDTSKPKLIMPEGNTLNLGCVVYTESVDGIEAEWVFSKNGEVEHGTGIGTRLTQSNEKKRFEGEYEITYSDGEGNRSPKLNLIISFDLGHYHLKWSLDEKITDIGIGIEKDNKLLVSYTKAG